MTSKAFQNVIKLNALAANVRDFGAIGDGATNDAAAFQAAIDSGAKVIGGTPGDTYAIGASGILLLNKTGVTLDFTGCKIKVLAASTQTMTSLGSTVILFNGCTDCGIVNAEIDGNAKASNLIGFLSCTRGFAENNHLYSGGFSGQIAAINNSGNVYRYNILRNSHATGRGMWLGNYGANLLERNAMVVGNQVFSNGATGIVLSAENTICSENYVHSNQGSGIIFGGFNGYCSNNVTITGNHCEANLFHGIQADTSYSTDADLPYAIAITANTCKGNSPSGSSSGIYVVNTSKTLVDGNTCSDNGEYGIVLGVRLLDITISDNVIFDSRSGGARTQAQAINHNAQTQNQRNIQITGNVCSNHTSQTISITTTSPATIDNVVVANNVCDGGTHGIFIAEAALGEMSRVVVTNNVCRNASTVDLRASLLDVVLSGNRYDTQQDVLYWTFADADTTPSVKGRTFYQASNTGATTITTFDDGVPGQEITVFASNGNTTLGHGSGINTPTGSGVVIPSGGSVTLRRSASAWDFLSQSF